MSRCLINLAPAISALTGTGTAFRNTVLSFGGVVHLIWRTATRKRQAGFTVEVCFICRVDAEIDGESMQDHFKRLLVQKRVADPSPSESGHLVVIRRVKDLPKVIERISRLAEPLPHNLDEIPAATIDEVFGHPRELFRLYGRRTLRGHAKDRG
jgi:hypothetical protein